MRAMTRAMLSPPFATMHQFSRPFTAVDIKKNPEKHRARTQLRWWRLPKSAPGLIGVLAGHARARDATRAPEIKSGLRRRVNATSASGICDGPGATSTAGGGGRDQPRPVPFAGCPIAVQGPEVVPRSLLLQPKGPRCWRG